MLSGYAVNLCLTSGYRVKSFIESGTKSGGQGGGRNGRTGDVEFLLVPMKKEERREFYLQHLEKIKSVTAIFAVSDYYAIDLMSFLNGQGISVPKDISLAGFDDIPVCQMINPPLTTIKQDNHLRAKLAIEKLKDLKENKETGTEIILPVSLVVRKSTAPL